MPLAVGVAVGDEGTSCTEFASIATEGGEEMGSLGIVSSLYQIHVCETSVHHEELIVTRQVSHL